MPTLTDILQMSEVALTSRDVWPGATLHRMNSSNSVRLGGKTLEQLNTQVVQPSSHGFLTEERFSIAGFKYSSALVSWAKPGTQPTSTRGPISICTTGVGENHIYMQNGYTYMRQTYYNGSTPTTHILGYPQSTKYDTTQRRNIQYVIIHACGGGGGGGARGLVHDGSAGGSGAIIAILACIKKFTSNCPLIISVPSGGTRSKNGGNPAQSGGDCTISWNLPDAWGNNTGTFGGRITLGGGKGGKYAANNRDNPGIGGTIRYEGNQSELNSVFSILNSSNGTTAQTQPESKTPNLSYEDPTIAKTLVDTDKTMLGQTIDGSGNLVVYNHGAGGAGGTGANYNPGQNGHTGLVHIYY